MRHEAGLFYILPFDSIDDLLPENIINNSIGKNIEQSKAYFPLDKTTKRKYHAFSRGWILGEIIRRVDPKKRTMG